MLSHLVIRNFAVIDFTQIEFGHGLTVLTGETGAGKSIIINALNLLLGGRANTDVIRTGSEHAVVEGIFELDDSTAIDETLDSYAIAPCEGQLVVRRLIARNGRNKVFLNGSATTLATLQQITRGLVDVSGQHEHVSLLDPERHLDILDAYAKLLPLRKTMSQRYDAVASIRRDIETLSTDMTERLNRIDYLKFQLDEIEAAELVDGEIEAANEELEQLKHASRIEEYAQKAIALCYEDERSVNMLLAESVPAIRTLGSWLPEATTLSERLEEARILVEDVVHDLTRLAQTVEDNPTRIDHLMARLETIKHLERKHGGDIAHILKYADSMRAELHRLENAEAQTSELDAALKKETDAALEVAKKLHKKRIAAANKLSGAVEKELADLNMSGTRFVVSFSDAESGLNRRGSDTIEFLVSPNIGEDAKPIQKIASGGELSRIMLALKTVHTERDTVATYIFDEVDSGIGGETADRVGDKLATTAKKHQVLCITHLAQIASRANDHMVVAKDEVDGRTVSSISKLDDNARVEEIARMLGGERVSEKTREAARELLRI